MCFSNEKFKSLKMITDNKYNNLALLLSDQNAHIDSFTIYQIVISESLQISSIIAPIFI